ncbi:hypothetical protein E3O59_12930 [Cryobacterium sp. MDB2-33-2]|nr:hypothetical protein E3O59_12930 [Cryobacterium sp. MDB2-33-2]
MRGVYCTIVAQNYLPQALALYASIRATEPGRTFVVLVIDGDRSDLEVGRPALRVLGTNALGLTYRELLDLATIYDVVEWSTAVKPVFLKFLLQEFEQVVYLDPDTYMVSPLMELEALIDEYDVVLTPHLLEPVTPGASFVSEVNSLTVGVHNLGFCAVGRGSIPFLDWWWSHLERECLIYPLLGLFVDQKWTDVGAVIFEAHSLRHYGYNIGHWNLHERFFSDDGSGMTMTTTGEPLRLFHFSGFDPRDPGAISVRQNVSLRDSDLGSEALDSLSHEYASLVLQAEAALGARPPYGYERDASGKRLTKRVRRTFRKDLLAENRPTPPSPFVESDRKAFAHWRRESVGRLLSGAAADAAIAMKYAFPDSYGTLKSTLPRQFGWIRGVLLKQSRIRR